MMKRRVLLKCKPENVRRLALYLGLRVQGLSDRHIAKLIIWRLSPNRQWRF